MHDAINVLDAVMRVYGKVFHARNPVRSFTLVSLSFLGKYVFSRHFLHVNRVWNDAKEMNGRTTLCVYLSWVCVLGKCMGWIAYRFCWERKSERDLHLKGTTQLSFLDR